MYHHVTPAGGMIAATPDVFEDQIARRAGQSLSADQFAACLAGAPVPERSVLITFDDGYLNNWVHAHPVLARHGMRAVLFIITGWIGDGPVRPHAGRPAARHAGPRRLQAAGRRRPRRRGHAALERDRGHARRRHVRIPFPYPHAHALGQECAGDVQAKRARIADELRLSREAPPVSDHGYFDADYVAAREPASGTCTLPTLSARTRPARIPSTSTASRCAIAAAPGSTGASGCRATRSGVRATTPGKPGKSVLGIADEAIGHHHHQERGGQHRQMPQVRGLRRRIHRGGLRQHRRHGRAGRALGARVE